MGVSLLINSYPKLPRLIGVNEEFKKLKTIDKAHSIEPISKKKTKLRTNQQAPPQILFKDEIRAGFLVNWDSISYATLRKNINSINLVLPEWLFVNPHTDSIVTQINWEAYNFIQAHHVKMIPLLSNFYEDKFNDSCIIRIVSEPEKRHKLISQLIGILERYGFDGVSIDFEDLYLLKNDQDLVEFHRELCDSLHAHEMLASQCIPPFNLDYNIVDLQKFNDYIFVMAYDEHYMTSVPGPVSSIKWVEKVLDYFTEEIESKKFVLCIAGYGYDWIAGGTARTVTFREDRKSTRLNSSHRT